ADCPGRIVWVFTPLQLLAVAFATGAVQTSNVWEILPRLKILKTSSPGGRSAFCENVKAFAVGYPASTFTTVDERPPEAGQAPMPAVKPAASTTASRVTWPG